MKSSKMSQKRTSIRKANKSCIKPKQRAIVPVPAQERAIEPEEDTDSEEEDNDSAEQQSAYHNLLFDEYKHCNYATCMSCNVIIKFLGVPKDTSIAFDVVCHTPLIPGVIDDADAACVTFVGKEINVTVFKASTTEKEVLYAVLDFDKENMKFNIKDRGISNDSDLHYALCNGHLF